MPKVKKINATSVPELETRKKKIKVAAYARVSTDHEEQDGSFEMQVRYFEERIRANPDWELVKVFADKGASGTCVEGREEFKEMVRVATSGGIDLILCKSISRFARNTVTTLETIRELKEKGVAVEFEKEGLRTDTNQGELMLTILSALAEQESKSISENIQWGIKAKFKDGKDVHNFCRFLGYEKGWVIVEEEAETVREIYKKYLEGMSMGEICRKLEEEGRLRQDGGKKWHVGSISYVLNNPAYCGDLILQKSVTVDYRGRVRKKNEGEEPMYYVEGHHPCIISPSTYQRAQLEIKRRKGHAPADFSVSPFFGSVFTSSHSPAPQSTTNPSNHTTTNPNNQSTTQPEACEDDKEFGIEAEWPGSRGDGKDEGREDGAGEAQEEEKIMYRRVTIHSNVEKWKKIVWKPQTKKRKKTTEPDNHKTNKPNNNNTSSAPNTSPTNPNNQSTTPPSNQPSTKEKNEDGKFEGREDDKARGAGEGREDDKKKKPAIWPTISEEELYRIFGLAVVGLVERKKEIKEQINQQTEEAKTKIPEIEQQRENLLAKLKKKLNTIAVETDEEKYEELVVEYNREREKYEKLGDEAWAMEEKMKSGERLITELEKIPTLPSNLSTSILSSQSTTPLSPEQKTTNPNNQSTTQAPACEDDKVLGIGAGAAEDDEAGGIGVEKLSEIYRGLGCTMEVGFEDVTVDFGAGVKEKVGIEKKDKSWRAK